MTYSGIMVILIPKFILFRGKGFLRCQLKNEAVLSYAPGSVERKTKLTLTKMYNKS